MMQMSLRNQFKAGRYKEIGGPRGRIKFINEMWPKYEARAHKIEKDTIIPVLTSAVIFEKVPTGRNTQQRKR